MNNQRMLIVCGLAAGVWVAGSRSTFAQDTAAPPDSVELNEATRLFALAMDHWDESTSPYVEDLLRKSLAIRTANLPPTDPKVAEVEDQLGRVYYNRGVTIGPLASFRQAEALFAKAAAAGDGPQVRSLTLARYLGDLGASVREQHRFADALVAVCKSMAMRRSLLPPQSPQLAGSLDNLSRIEAGEGNKVDAIMLSRDAERLTKGLTGEDDPAARALKAFCSEPLTS